MELLQGRSEGKTGELLKKLRRDGGYTLKHVADAVGCSPSYLHRLENNSRKNPSMKIARELAQFYGIDSNVLTGEDVETKAVANVMANADLRSELLSEVETAISMIKEGVKHIESNPEFGKQLLVSAQKNLLYIKSLF